MYQKNYGDVMIIPGTKTAVAICFTGDNHGPQSIESVKNIYIDLQQRFPNAIIHASDLNKVAKEISKVESKIPIITEEMGDTWIHGTASDPWKIARFRELCRLRKEWIESGDWKFGDVFDIKFGLPLMKIAEHTWGLDVKSHLKDWEIYLPNDFNKARIKSNFKKMENSWQEKRNYLDEAILSLSDRQRRDIEDRLNNLNAELPNLKEYRKLDLKNNIIQFDTEYFNVGIDGKNGAINRLYEKKTNRNWLDGSNSLALFTYQTFSKKDYDRFHSQYLTQTPWWAIADFGKPGIEKFNIQSRTWVPTLNELFYKKNNNSFSIVSKSRIVDNNMASVGGSPQLIITKFDFTNDNSIINLDLQWFDKRAYRLPEAMWLSFVPKTIISGEWEMDKMGYAINPQKVIKNGNRKLHGIIEGIKYHDNKHKFDIKSLDAPLVAPGKKSLLDFNNELPEIEDGMHFCLYNNVWGTNFMMWFEENMRYRFQIKIDSIT
jgi:hypothetical protein